MVSTGMFTLDRRPSPTDGRDLFSSLDQDAQLLREVAEANPLLRDLPLLRAQFHRLPSPPPDPRPPGDHAAAAAVPTTEAPPKQVP